ncbi:aldo/keto reductase [Streptomyces liangshanensis]|uniref:Oxidoreductase n=1 Tax=Streptomyces liangshanensis TaxID=2717324 RepID=A0A6G9H6W1_9ACTN|nr:aldo/keto reductase [Streptomyces liangshanensis]QIQ06273.1 oxidoreductase [Streptomyces liangshanensis]
MTPSSASDPSVPAPRPDFPLGGTTTIPRLGFGAMQLPGRWNGPAHDRSTALAVARRAVELGARHLDTAAFYFAGDVRANDLLREALHPYPADLTLATKVGPLRNPAGEMYGEATAEQLRPAVERNLRELDVDVLDLVYLRVGRLSGKGGPPLGERFAVLAALRDEGLIRHLGVSNVSPEQLAEARAVAPVAAVQNRFGVLDQEDAALVDTCAAAGIAYMPFFALGGAHGGLADDTLRAVAERHGATAHQVALAWGLARSPSIVQIPGTASLAHLEENMAATGVVLDAADLALLGKAAG